MYLWDPKQQQYFLLLPTCLSLTPQHSASTNEPRHQLPIDCYLEPISSSLINRYSNTDHIRLERCSSPPRKPSGTMKLHGTLTILAAAVA